MSKSLGDIEEARLGLAYISGKHTGIEMSAKFIGEKAATFFMWGKDGDAKLLRSLADALGRIAKDVYSVRAQKLKELGDLENADNTH